MLGFWVQAAGSGFPQCGMPAMYVHKEKRDKRRASNFDVHVNPSAPVARQTLTPVRLRGLVANLQKEKQQLIGRRVEWG
jgi:hypothetical protein